MAYEIFWEPEGVVVRFYNMMVWEDAVNYRQELLADTRFKALRYRIYDTRDAKGIQATDKEATRAALLDKELARISLYPCKIASVSDREDVQLIAGLYGIALDVPSWKFASFVDMEMARRWVVDK